LQQPDRHMMADGTMPSNQHPQRNISLPDNPRNYGKSALPTVSTHISENESDVRLISSGFSVNKTTLGSFIVRSVTSCDIRRLEVGDVITAIDGYVLSQQDALYDVVYLLEEPIGTVARLTLVKGSGGVAGVVRKSVQFLRMSGLPRNETFDRPFLVHDADIVSQSDELDQADSETFDQQSPNGTHNFDADETCYSDHTDFSGSVSSEHGILLSHAGVGIGFREDKTLDQRCFIVDHILQQSPAHRCGKVDGMLSPKILIWQSPFLNFAKYIVNFYAFDFFFCSRRQADQNKRANIVR
jgi:hypothetical protein